MASTNGGVIMGMGHPTRASDVLALIKKQVG